jgi:ABC-type sulfate/molybdate transport systems ATPase subunit
LGPESNLNILLVSFFCFFFSQPSFAKTPQTNKLAKQVTCLLGHNGAGKSTTISMLTGLTPPSAGDATVFGRSLVHDLAGVRRSLGVYPQTNVIFPALTVREHLYFFVRVKVSDNCSLFFFVVGGSKKQGLKLCF